MHKNVFIIKIVNGPTSRILIYMTLFYYNDCIQISALKFQTSDNNNCKCSIMRPSATSHPEFKIDWTMIIGSSKGTFDSNRI